MVRRLLGWAALAGSPRSWCRARERPGCRRREFLVSRQEPKLRGLGLPEEKKDARNRGSRPAGQALSTSREAMAEKAWGGGCYLPPKEHRTGQRGGTDVPRRHLNGGGHLGRPSLVRWASVSNWDGRRVGGRTGPRGPGSKPGLFLYFFFYYCG